MRRLQQIDTGIPVSRLPAAPVMDETEPTDDELVRAVVAGATPAFAALYDRYGGRAYSLARRVCVDEGLAAADTGLAHCRDTTERLFEAALWRLKGELLLRRGPSATHARGAAIRDADECFDKARVVARAQGAPMLERRASRRDAGATAPRKPSR